MAKKDNYIYYNGERLNLSEWVPMAIKAKELGYNEAYVRLLVHRSRNNKGKKRIEYKDIPELGLTLVSAAFTNG